MEHICHRCGATLGTPDTFCPNCGAPQLRFEPTDEHAALLSGRSLGQGFVDPEGISWKHAVGAAVTVAVPMGLLSSSLLPGASLGCCLWVVGGAVGAVALYHRRAASAMLNIGAGARIGAVAGVIAAFVASMINGLQMVFQRFALHSGAEIDTEMQKVIDQMSASVSQSPPQSQAQMQDMLHFFSSPDGRAAMMLMASASSAVAIVLFSAIGGALGARIFASRRGPVSNA